MVIVGGILLQTNRLAYIIIGAPVDVAGAQRLKEISPHQFEWWAVDLVNTRPAKDRKKGAASGGSTSASVAPGQTASYPLSVAPLGGFSQAVTLSCSGAPSEATCSVSPASVTPPGVNPATVTVSVTTTASSLAMPRLAPRAPLGPGGSRIFNLQSPIRYLARGSGRSLPLAGLAILGLLLFVAANLARRTASARGVPSLGWRLAPAGTVSHRRPASPVGTPALHENSPLSWLSRFFPIPHPQSQAPSPCSWLARFFPIPHPQSQVPSLRSRLASLRARLVICGSVLLIVLWASCGGGGTTLRNPGTPAGTYTLTVTATTTSGSSTLRHNLALTLTVQ